MKFRTIAIIFIVVLLSMIIIPRVVTSTTLGTFQRGEDIMLYQICDNCTYNNISTVLFPNSSIALINISMTKDDTYYFVEFNQTDLLGTYIVNGYGGINGAKTSWVYDFEITGSGFEFNQARSSFTIALLGLLVFFLLLTLFSISKLPEGNDRDEFGRILSINNLKHLRPVLYGISWSILLSITFISSNIAQAYMGDQLLSTLLFVVWRMMFVMTLPMVIIFTLVIFINIFKDIETKKMLERGVDIGQI